MKLGIMQPYFFPYPGYFQLIAHCDTFVFYDDVQFIKGGWINRNKILFQCLPKWFTYPVEGGSTYATINNRRYVAYDKVYGKLENQLSDSYRYAAFFEETLTLFQKIMMFKSRNVAVFNMNLLRMVTQYIGLNANFLTSSELDFDRHKKGAERVLEICRLTKADTYVNPAGGVNLYQGQKFSDEGVSLQFIKPGILQYDQGCDEFVAMLSILDFLMFNPVIEVKKSLEESYSIVNLG